MKSLKPMGAAQASKQAGFTIIELVVVILLLGILTATALPRFLDITEEAHDAVVDGVEGGFRTGVALFRANWFALGQPTAALTDWGNLVPSSTGYPVGTSGGAAGDETDLNTECEDIFDNILQSGAPDTIDVSEAPISQVDATDYTATDADLASVNGTADFLAAHTAANTCTYYYIADAQRQTSAAPSLTYVSTTGVLTRAN